MKNWLLPLHKTNWLLLSCLLGQITSVAAQAPPPGQAQMIGRQTLTNDNAVFLETEIRPAQPYVQAQITYTITLYYLGRLLQIKTSLPELHHADMQAIGNGRSATTTRKNREFSVWERKYAIFAEQSGRLKIAPLRVSAWIVGQESSASGVLQGHRAELFTAPLELTVQPSPPAVKAAYWLPAEHISLNSLPIRQPLQIGQPFAYTLVLEAKGLRGFQLPDIELTHLPWANGYTEQTAVQSKQSDDHIIGRRETRFTLIPQHTGQFNLPEIRLNWWDTNTDRPAIAQLPAIPLSIAGTLRLPAKTPAGQDDEHRPSWSIWFWINAALMTLWLLTFLAWRRSQRKRAVR